MDIGVPYRKLGPVDVGPALDLLASLTEADWETNRIRQDLLTASPHRNTTRSIILKYNWLPYQRPWGMRTMRELVEAWCRQENVPSDNLIPELEHETDQGHVNVFPQWKTMGPVIGPLVDQATAYLNAPRGIATRIAIVEMVPNGKIAPHVDGQAHAAAAHRLHIPLISPPGVEYKIDGKKFRMEVDQAYDFNNRKQHGVRNKSPRPRVNILVDFLPNPGPPMPTALPPRFGGA
jgi:hypothetical protein